MTHMDSVLLRKVGIEGWEACIMEAVTGGMLITGGVPHMVGHKKKWPPRKTMERVLLTHAEIEAEYARYEAETGNCHACYGSGKETYGWTVVDGAKYRICPHCKGVGRVS